MAGELQSMCQYWKNFDLHGLQRELDSTATDLATRQDDSDASRKRLVEQSREFKKNTPEETRKVVAPLLKSFQAEIDALSKRSKAAEAAFLSVYKRLIDLPDPVPVLEHSLTLQKKAQRLSDLEIENKQLRETLEEYNNEFAEVKNQEVTIKQLREKLKEYEEKMESVTDNKAKEIEKELHKQFAEKEGVLQETQLDVARKLGEQEQKVAELQRALEANQSELFDVRHQYEELASAKASEIEIMSNDLERANEKVATAERQVEKLLQQLASANQNLHQAEEMQKAPDMEQAIDIIKRSSLEVELAAKEKEISQLVEDVQRLQATISKLYDSGSSQVAKLEEELSDKSRSLQMLEEKVKSQEDYEEIKRELRVLKSIEYNQTEDADSTSKDKPKSLEILLLEKNRTLQTENTQLKVTNKDVTGTSAQNSVSTMDNTFTSMVKSEIDSTYQQDKKSPSSSNGRPISPLNIPICRNNLQSPSSCSSQSSPLYKSYQSDNGELDLSIPRSKIESGTDVLDTAEVSLKIREILSIHNIGQRIFAKHVLGLSQGTVSELLSKPKHWDKLTEKGRESYRKMAQWANDENNIMILKAMSPKKGGPTILPGYKQEDSATEQRICRILNEAQNAMKVKNSQEQIHSSAIVSTIYQQQLDKINQERASVRPPELLPRKYQDEPENTSISEEIVARIYREELEKLAESACARGNVAETSLYQQELARLAMNAQYKDKMRRDRNDSRRDSDSSRSPRGDVSGCVKRESYVTNGHSSPSACSERHAGSAFSLVRPRSNSSGEVGLDLTTHKSPKSSDPESPLQRMQNIANSILTKSHGGLPLSAKPLRAVLPPITQEQFDEYSDLDTDKLVTKVKECLSQYSISQRLFGEYVLGLSQGSVSDLLARPKPWNMLTQKGREPFIRMKIFLEDNEAIQRLVTNQYRVAPEKFIRQNHGVISPGVMEEARRSASTPTYSRTETSNKSGRSSAHDYSLYEMALMTSELDTIAITSSVKEVLQFHNVGQKLFGEVILGLSQGSVSELLSKPKPWHMLSLKGREPFVKMHLWLQDPLNVERLKLYQNEMKVYGKRSSGMDEKGEHPHLSSKKARVSFTDEQKEMLRLAYLRDPYPNTAAIDVLANDIGVGSRTVVNWFHNHRMRSKQTQPPPYGGLQIKTELLEESSNHSDSVSSDSNYVNNNTSQWMFPSFEAIRPPSSSSTHCSEKVDVSVRTEPFLVQEKNSEILQNGKCVEDDIPATATQTFTGVNKRKSAKPQRVFDTSAVSDETSEKGPESPKLCESLQNDTPIMNGIAEKQQQDSIPDNQIKPDGPELSISKNHLNEEDTERKKKLQQLQRAVEMTDLSWDDMDSRDNIEKLEQNLEKPDEQDWEF